MPAERRTVILVALTVAGVIVLCVLAWLLVYDPANRPWIQTHQYPFVAFDLLARMSEVHNARAGSNIYIPLNSSGFTYPPPAIILFLPFTYVPFNTTFLIWNLLTMVCLALTFLVVLRVTRTGPWLLHVAIAIWACVLCALLFPPMQDTLAWGQTSTLLLLLVAVDVLAVRGRSQGVLLGLATALKLYPGVVIVFWLVRRQRRPAITATISFLLITAISWALWPRSSWWFFSKLLIGGREITLFELPGTVNISSAPLSFFLRIRLLPHTPAVVAGVFVSALLAVVGLWLAARLDRLGYKVSALVMLVCTSVIISPLAWDHYFTFAPLLVFVIMEVGLRSPAGEVAAIALAIFAFPWEAYRGQFLHSTLQQNLLHVAAQNAVFIAALLVMVSGGLAVKRGAQLLGSKHSSEGSAPEGHSSGKVGLSLEHGGIVD